MHRAHSCISLLFILSGGSSVKIFKDICGQGLDMEIRNKRFQLAVLGVVCVFVNGKLYDLQ